MKIIKRKSDDVVIFAEYDLNLTAEGASGRGWISNLVTSADHALEEVGALPQYFIGLGWKYNGTFTQTAEGAAYQAKVESYVPPVKPPTIEERLAAVEGKVTTLETKVEAK